MFSVLKHFVLNHFEQKKVHGLLENTVLQSKLKSNPFVIAAISKHILLYYKYTVKGVKETRLAFKKTSKLMI